MSDETPRRASYSEGSTVRVLDLRPRTRAATELVQEVGQAVGEGAVELVERDAQHAVDRHRVAADLTDHARGAPEGRQRRSRAGDEEGARAFAEQLLLRRQPRDHGAEP